MRFVWENACFPLREVLAAANFPSISKSCFPPNEEPKSSGTTKVPQPLNSTDDEVNEKVQFDTR